MCGTLTGTLEQFDTSLKPKGTPLVDEQKNIVPAYLGPGAPTKVTDVVWLEARVFGVFHESADAGTVFSLSRGANKKSNTSLLHRVFNDSFAESTKWPDEVDSYDCTQYLPPLNIRDELRLYSCGKFLCKLTLHKYYTAYFQTLLSRKSRHFICGITLLIVEGSK